MTCYSDAEFDAPCRDLTVPGAPLLAACCSFKFFVRGLIKSSDKRQFRIDASTRSMAIQQRLTWESTELKLMATHLGLYRLTCLSSIFARVL